MPRASKKNTATPKAKKLTKAQRSKINKENGLEGGRPRKELDFDLLATYVQLQATAKECASFFDMSVSTLDRRIREKYGFGFDEYFEEKSKGGLLSLRASGFAMAKKNPVMNIFLSKQFLGMSNEGLKALDSSKSNIFIPATEISNIFIKNYHSCINDKNITINRGGTSSTKTVSLGQIAMTFLLTGKIGEKKGKQLDITGQTLPQLKETILKDFWTYADAYGFSNLFDHKKTDKKIIFNDRVVNYFSADDDQKVKGRRRDFLIIGESDGIKYDTFRQLQMRTNLHTFLEFNPDNEFIWINEELEKTRAKEFDDVVVIQSSYKDNPFLNDKIIHEIEMLQKLDPEYWQIFGLGNYGSVSGLIFKNWQSYSELPEAKTLTFYGLDLGYSNSETALLRGTWEVNTAKLYLEECFYKKGLDYPDVIDLIKSHNPDNDPIFSDTNESRMVGTLRKSGVNIFTPPKDVLKSIALMQSFDLFVSENSVNLQKEIKHYKWLKKNGTRVNEPLKFLDHLIDAGRYMVTGFCNMIAPKYKGLASILNNANKIAKG